jgi:hypothetical protein
VTPASASELTSTARALRALAPYCDRVAAEVRIRAYDAANRAKRPREDDQSTDEEGEVVAPAEEVAVAPEEVVVPQEAAPTVAPQERVAPEALETIELEELEVDEAAKPATAAAIQRIRDALITPERATLFLELVFKLERFINYPKTAMKATAELTVREGDRDKRITLPQYRKYVQAGDGFRITSHSGHHVYRIADPDVWFDNVAVPKSQTTPWLSIDDYMASEVREVLAEGGEAQ